MSKAAKKEQGGAATPATQEKHVPVNNFNDGEVKQMMGQGATSSVYKVETSAKASDRKSFHNEGFRTITEGNHSSQHGNREKLLGSFARASHSCSNKRRREAVDTDDSTRHTIHNELDSYRETQSDSA